MSDWTIRIWHKWNIQEAENPDKPHMYHMKEFKKGEESHVAEWVLKNREMLSECIITDGSKQLKFVLESK